MQTITVLSRPDASTCALRGLPFPITLQTTMSTEAYLLQSPSDLALHLSPKPSQGMRYGKETLLPNLSAIR